MLKFQTSPKLPDSLKDKKKMIFGYIKTLHTFHDGYVFLSVHVCKQQRMFVLSHSLTPSIFRTFMQLLQESETSHQEVAESFLESV